MCGINGIVSFGAGAQPVDAGELTRTREAMHSRGPDAAGIWLSPDGRTGFGHRRLSIIDVSHRADQPMVSREGDMVLCDTGITWMGYHSDFGKTWICSVDPKPTAAQRDGSARSRG